MPKGSPCTSALRIKTVMCLYGIFFMGWVHNRLPGCDAVGWEWVSNERCVGFTHVWDDLVGLRVQWWGRRRGWRRGPDWRADSVQVLDAPLVVLAQLQRVGEGVVCGHDGSRLTRVLQAEDVPELMGSNLEEVCACKGGTMQNHKWLRWCFGRLFWPS